MVEDRSLAQEITRQLLGQVRPGAATPTVLYTVPTGVTDTTITQLNIVNNHATNADTIEIWHDDDGSAATDAELIWFGDVAAKTTEPDLTDLTIELSNSAGTITVESLNGTTTITAYGRERRQAL